MMSFKAFIILCLTTFCTSVVKCVNVGEATFNTTKYLEEKKRFQQVEKIITETQKTQNVLDARMRLKLMDETLDCYFNDEILIRKSGLQAIAKRICEGFEHDVMEIYFFDKDGKVGGKLYHRYNNRLKKLRTNSLMPTSARSSKKIARPTEREIFIISESQKKSIDYLSGDSFESVSIVTSHWENTFDYRQDLIKDSNIVLTDILSKWKCLEFSFSYVLICQDFRKMFGSDSAASLRKNWSEFFNKDKMEILQMKVKDKKTLSAIKNLLASNGITKIHLK